MGNNIVSPAERLFLREGILKKYCKLVGYAYDDFESGLTGTIGHYERISDVMADHIDEESNFSRYIGQIGESPLKIQLKKLMQGREEERKKFLRDLKSFASANVLRKLIFYGSGEGEKSQKEEKMSFKELFITACYYYIQADRTDFLRKAPVVAPRKKGGGTIDTQSPVHQSNDVSDGHTVSVFRKERGFSLKILKDNNTEEVDETKRPLQFGGESVSLNRDNLEPDNFTITSKVQAEIKLVDGQWYIENKSGLKTTFIQVLTPVKLNKGDVIIMGNKRFLFEG
jgi:hypothetical protein